ncbi:MAG: signal peptidase I [Chloroflexota bacterium]
MTATLAITTLARRILDVVLVVLIAVVVLTVVFARVIPAVSGASTLVVGGGSMEPAIPIGSVVVASPVVPADLAVGDVVSLQVGPDRAIFTHRITRLVPREDGLWIETKGDANAAIDPSIIPATDVIGRVTTTIPSLGFLVVLLSTFQGVAFLVGLGVLVLVGAWLLETLEDDQRVTIRRRLAVAGAPIDVAPGGGVAG